MRVRHKPAQVPKPDDNTPSIHLRYFGLADLLVLQKLLCPRPVTLRQPPAQGDDDVVMMVCDIYNQHGSDVSYLQALAVRLVQRSEILARGNAISLDTEVDHDTVFVDRQDSRFPDLLPSQGLVITVTFSQKG
jgi:hypothetical protein